MVAPAGTPLAPVTPHMREVQKRQQIDYRLMVEAIQSGDLTSAREAFDRLKPQAAPGASADILTEIGARLQDGDLLGAQKTLDGLQAKALTALRQAAADQALRKVLVPTGPNGRKVNLSI